MEHHYSILYEPFNKYIWRHAFGFDVPDHVIMALLVLVLSLIIFPLMSRNISKDNPGGFQQFLERRAEQPAETVEQAIQDGGLSPLLKPFIDVKSRYFQIQGEVFVGSSRVALYSLIHRPDSRAPTVLAHSADAE